MERWWSDVCYCSSCTRQVPFLIQPKTDRIEQNVNQATTITRLNSKQHPSCRTGVEMFRVHDSDVLVPIDLNCIHDIHQSYARNDVCLKTLRC